MFHKSYDIGDSLDVNYPPRIEIHISNSPVTAKSEPLLLNVKGLSKTHAFRILPGTFLQILFTHKA